MKLSLSELTFREEISGKPDRGFKYTVEWKGSKVATLESQLEYISSDSRRRVYTIYELKVEPLFRRRGIGSLILKQCEEYARQHGVFEIVCKIYSLDRTVDESALIAFYKKNNFIIDREIFEREVFAFKKLDKRKLS